jgi:hypothetical protein
MRFLIQERYSILKGLPTRSAPLLPCRKDMIKTTSICLVFGAMDGLSERWMRLRIIRIVIRGSLACYLSIQRPGPRALVVSF